jgi:hypothetical protein
VLLEGGRGIEGEGGGTKFTMVNRCEGFSLCVGRAVFKGEYAVEDGDVTNIIYSCSQERDV